MLKSDGRVELRDALGRIYKTRLTRPIGKSGTSDDWRPRAAFDLTKGGTWLKGGTCHVGTPGHGGIRPMPKNRWPALFPLPITHHHPSTRNLLDHSAMASHCCQADANCENNGEHDVLMQCTMHDDHFICAAPPNGLDCLNIDKFHQYLAYRSENTVPDAPPYKILVRTRLVVLGIISINYATSHATSPIDTISTFLDDARVPHLEADINFRCTHGDGNEWEAVISYRRTSVFSQLPGELNSVT
ncbi:hypothetical protein C8R47DRAFT_459332 [Mycena vitilis]|nr:hypothetical protein C8R47DRAFT_459332 [Mycena vitilis]